MYIHNLLRHGERIFLELRWQKSHDDCEECRRDAHSSDQGHSPGVNNLRGLRKPQLFDENDAAMSLFLYLKTIRSFDVVDTSPDKCHRHPRNQHIGIPQIQYTDKVADESVAVQRQISPRTETKKPEHQ